MKKIIALLSLCIMFSSCGILKPIDKVSTDENKLTTHWVLLNDGNVEYGLNTEPLSLTFTKGLKENKINGFAGCNNFFGEYSAYNGSLIINNIASTKMACPQLDAENQYLSLLRKSNRYEIKGKNLYLYKGNLALLHFKQK